MQQQVQLGQVGVGRVAPVTKARDPLPQSMAFLQDQLDVSGSMGPSAVDQLVGLNLEQL